MLIKEKLVIKKERINWFRVMAVISLIFTLQSCAKLFIPKRMRTDYFEGSNRETQGTSQYQEFRFVGSSFELGYQLGIKLKNLDIYPSEMQGRERELYLFQYALLEEIHPPMVDYLRGMAAAYSMDFDNDKDNYCFFVSVMNLNFACSAIYIAPDFHEDGQATLSRNYDFFNHYGNLSKYELDGVHPVIGHSFMYGYPYLMDGMNDQGLAVIANMEVDSVNGASSYSYPLPTYNGLEGLLVVRLILETCTTAQEARELLRTLPVCSTGPRVHLLIGDAQGDSFIAAFDFEETGEVTFFERTDNTSFQVMTNFAERTRGYQGNMGYQEGPCVRYSLLQDFYENRNEAVSTEIIADSLYSVRMSPGTREMNQGMSHKIDTVIQIYYNLTDRAMIYRIPQEDFSIDHPIRF